MKKFFEAIVLWLTSLFNNKINFADVEDDVPDPDPSVVGLDLIRENAIRDVEKMYEEIKRPRRQFGDYVFFNTFADALNYMNETFNLNFSKKDYLTALYSNTFKNSTLKYFINVIRVAGFGKAGIDYSYPVYWFVSTKEQILNEGIGHVGRQAYRKKLVETFTKDKLVEMAIGHVKDERNKKQLSFGSHITSTSRKFKNMEEIKNILNIK